MQRLFITTIVSISLLFVLSANSAWAAECTIIYGGGEIACAKLVVSPTSTPAQSFNELNQTKGGLPVNQPVQATTTPNTGPEAFSLIGLIPAAAAGFWLRRKMK